jgi:nitroreductase
MDAYTCIRTKRDTRAYQDRPIPEPSLRRILQAGRMAGSARNLQPCRFVVIQDASKKKELANCGQFAQHMTSAPLAVAVVLPRDGREFDAGRCAQNMMLAAWAEGITSCPITMHDSACALRVLGVPQGHRVSIVLAFGYPPPSEPRPKGTPRIALEELLHWGGW